MFFPPSLNFSMRRDHFHARYARLWPFPLGLAIKNLWNKVKKREELEIFFFYGKDASFQNFLHLIAKGCRLDYDAFSL